MRIRWLARKLRGIPAPPETGDQYYVDRWKVEARRSLARLVPAFHYGQCGCCHLPWWVVDGHVVQFTESQGCFAVCESCWRDVNRSEIWPFYRDLIRENHPEHPKWEENLRRAVFGDVWFETVPSKPAFDPLPDGDPIEEEKRGL